MKKKSYLVALVFSFILGFLLLDYGINHKGVMLSIVGASLILQGLSILMVIPLYKDEEKNQNNIIKDIASNYIYFLDSILKKSNSKNGSNIYVPFKNDVKVLVMNKQKIITVFELPHNELSKIIQEKCNPEKYTDIKKFLEDIEDILLEKNLVKGIRHSEINGYDQILIKEPITLKYCEQINKASPSLFRLLGCPISSTIINLISQYKKTAITASFSIEKDSIKVIYSPVKINEYSM